ncbi:MAG: TerC family protein [Desulfobacteraceae bacterium]|nr:MAG: TerC family protein [Desulfobacteraceae bacterium]
MIDSILMLLLLVGLELVLGVDNILVISIFVGRLPAGQRNRARIIGLSLAFLARIVMLFILLKLSGLTQNVMGVLSVRDLILLAGGLFLIWKAVTEIHHTVELKEEQTVLPSYTAKTFRSIILQIVLLDIVFSIDSVITAIGLTDKLWIIIAAVMLAILAILAFAQPIGEFLIQRPSLKILALAFLITIGITIFMEGLDQHVPKGYIYLPMGFALFVEMLQLRYEHNRRQKSRTKKE